MTEAGLRMCLVAVNGDPAQEASRLAFVEVGINRDKAEAVLWLEDERLSEIEDFVPEPMGTQGVRYILDWNSDNGRPGDKMNFWDVKAYSLSPEVIYATVIQEQDFDEPRTRGVTFIFFNKDDDWGIIQAC